MAEAGSVLSRAAVRLWPILPLCLLLTVLLLALGLLHGCLDERIADNARRERLSAVHTVVPERYRGDLLSRHLALPAHPSLGGPTEAFPVLSDGRQPGIVLMPITTRGYQGDITLLLGIRRDGMLWGVRALAHQETPGFGDRIEIGRSDWILGLSGYGLDSGGDRGEPVGRPGRFIPASRFALRQDGGEFDQLSGATITSRSVIEASRKALQYHDRHRAALYRE